ncbi:putative rRNA maturation factor [Roseibium hamelinense]|uniref:Endoribonuclease YbeY n=1 Tax=Roseibium hamelinense TaxID=150831 RepID=A0A562T3A9_9HYPH|nr:rRNA maturation RNase YbeY [Roseibium hamelinense]MTI44671.1 rRNA maturation RNase YbeY [Roseibium hamelinense]TWI87300.1 putative rRNA maturation factor [Roseibium hamelinense]
MTEEAAGAGDLVIDLSIVAGDWPTEERLAAVCKRAWAAAHKVASFNFQAGSEVSVVCTNDAAVQKLNKDWRGKNKPTNVLSFPASEPVEDVYGPLLGDIVLGFETISREADDLGIEFETHVTHLIVHGILHLFDYDHQEDDEAELMERMEIEILSCLGIENPYADRPLVKDA